MKIHKLLVDLHQIGVASERSDQKNEAKIFVRYQTIKMVWDALRYLHLILYRLTGFT